MNDGPIRSNTGNGIEAQADKIILLTDSGDVNMERATEREREKPVHTFVHRSRRRRLAFGNEPIPRKHYIRSESYRRQVDVLLAMPESGPTR